MYFGLRVYGVTRARLSGWRSWIRARVRAATMIGDYAVDRSRFELFDRIDADVMVVHGASAISAEIIAWCLKRKKPSIFIAGSDDDFLPQHREQPRTPTLYGDPGYVVCFAVANATAHVVQTPGQADRLRSIYGREATVVRNPIDLAREFPRDEDGTILWVGKSDGVKRPDLAIELARRLPSAKFLLVMNPSDPELYRQVEAAAAQLGNVQIEPVVPFARIEALFARASIFLSTSRVEGFPNTFLQAAKYEVPIASLAVDPAGMLVEHGAGVFARGDLDVLTRELDDLLSDRERRRAFGSRGLAYAREYHEREKSLEILESLILRVAGAGAVPSARVEGRGAKHIG
jgi:glycosyltransferase involved in cell wall biosynthesis